MHGFLLEQMIGIVLGFGAFFASVASSLNVKVPSPTVETRIATGQTIH
jgi:hypothetical protein